MPKDPAGNNKRSRETGLEEDASPAKLSPAKLNERAKVEECTTQTAEDCDVVDEDDLVPPPAEDNSDSDFDLIPSSESETDAGEEELREDDEDQLENENDDNLNSVKLSTSPFVPGVHSLLDGEELDYDPSAYEMYFRGSTDWPILSFDFVKDNLGMSRKKYPHTMYVVAGTQAEQIDANVLYVMRFSDLHRTKNDMDEDDSDAEEDENDPNGTDDDPTMNFRHIKYPHGCFNRVSCCPTLPRLVATWTEDKKVSLWDIEVQMNNLDTNTGVADPLQSPIFVYSGHQEEGYGLEFNPISIGELVSGSCDSNIALWKRSETGWNVSTIGNHSASVEELSWKKIGDGVGSLFISASADQSIAVWDTRQCRSPKVVDLQRAHNSDVNCVSWSHLSEHHILSGDDDGIIKVWDDRRLVSGAHLAVFEHHTSAISSLDWHPSDESVFVSAAHDHQVVLWDLSVEAAPEDETALPTSKLTDLGLNKLPEQCMFLHLGQRHPADAKFHPQIPGLILTAAENGFNVFRPAEIY